MEDVEISSLRIAGALTHRTSCSMSVSLVVSRQVAQADASGSVGTPVIYLHGGRLYMPHKRTWVASIPIARILNSHQLQEVGNFRAPGNELWSPSWDTVGVNLASVGDMRTTELDRIGSIFNIFDQERRPRIQRLPRPLSVRAGSLHCKKRCAEPCTDLILWIATLPPRNTWHKYARGHPWVNSSDRTACADSSFASHHE